MSSKNNFRELFDLHTKLLVSLGGKNQSEISKRVSALVSESTKNKTIHDESTVLSVIINHLTTTKSESEANAFRSAYERLVQCMEPNSRTSIIAFLFFMADTRKSSVSTSSSASTNSKNVSLLSDGKNFFANKIASSTSCQSVPSSNLLPSPHITSSISDNQLNLRQRSCSSAFTNLSSPRDDLDISVNQRKLSEDLVQEVIYSFTGVQGKYLKKDIISGGFKLDPKASTLSATDAGMLLRLSQLGYYHNHVQSYTDPKSGKGPLGLLGQGFVTALKDELTKYYGMIAMLQEQLNRSKLYDSADQITLMKVMLWVVEPMHRLQWLNTICEACQEKKGGDLATIVSNFRHNGDPMVNALVKDLLLATCRPLKHMLSKWLLEGEIEDPYSEFFVEILPDVGVDRLWSLKYRVRTGMLPCFISNKLANKILVTGKSINFLREICQDTTPISGKEDLKQHFLTNKDDLVSFIPDTKLHTLIDNVYFNTSKKVLDIVVGGHKLLQHLQAMKSYLLLGQGDFIGTLMENMKSQLDRPCKELHVYELNSILDAAIRSTTAKYDDPDITNQLAVSMLNDFHTDRGWDVFTLHYTVRGPLSTMLEPSMIKYHMLFKRLWALKHVEYVVCSKIWKDMICHAKLLRSMKGDLDAITYPLQLYTSTMIHFIQQIQYYILFEVIECSWASMLERIEKARALDDILEAHDEFLKDAHDGAFFNLNASIFSTMDSAFNACLKLEKWQEHFYDLCMKELSARKAEEEMIKTSGVKGIYGLTADKRLERDQERKVFEEQLPKLHCDLKVIGKDFESHARTVLLALASSNDHNLQLFGTRLDFNEFYKKRDQNLDAPLTFANIRHSSMMLQKQRNSSNRYNN